jgi:HlyD family secretion protein
MERESLKQQLEARLESFPGGLLNFAVWVASVVCVLAILSSRVAHVEYIGLAAAIEHEVSVAVPGTVSRVLVRAYQDVEQGELIAVLDDAQVSATLAVAAAELDSLQSQLDAATGEGGDATALDPAAVEWMAERRRFEVDVENRRIQALALGVELETDRVDEHRLRLRLRRAEPLHIEGAISLDQYDEIRFGHETVVTRIAENLVLLEGIEEELAAASARRDAYVGGSEDDAGASGYLAMLRTQIGLQEKRVEEIAAMRASLSLRAPISGRVAFLGARVGQAVDVGEPVVVVARTDVTEVTAWLPDGDARRLETGQRVLVRGESDLRLAESFVERVSPTVALLPQRLWRSPDYPEYGRAVVVAAVAGLDLTPGESVHVRFF